eukprot:3372806-Pyramimonas_sp.AAC.1
MGVAYNFNPRGSALSARRNADFTSAENTFHLRTAAHSMMACRPRRSRFGAPLSSYPSATSRLLKP